MPTFFVQESQKEQDSLTPWDEAQFYLAYFANIPLSDSEKMSKRELNQYVALLTKQKKAEAEVFKTKGK